MRAKTTWRGLMLMGLGIWALITGCTNPNFHASNPSATKAPVVLTLKVQPGETRAELEQRWGGHIVVWQPRYGLALMGLNQPIGPQSIQGSEATSEPNQRRFMAGGQLSWMSGQSGLWADGQSGLWADGQSTLWADGQSSLWAEGSYRLFPQNTNPFKQIALDKAHALSPKMGRGVKVAVIDTGIDLNHPMMVNSLVPASERWDFYADDPIPQEEGQLGVGGFGHGTSVAGIILQVAPAAKIMPLRVLGPGGSGDVLDLAAAINWAVDHGARVVNLSLGSDKQSSAVEAALQIATAQGVLIVASAGNTASSEVSYPASSAATQNSTLGWQRLSVTSISASGQKSVFAAYGESIELAAPGEVIYGPAPGSRVAAWSGTSMAAPMVSGALALVLAEPLEVSATDLADKLHQASNEDIYDDSLNQQYRNLLGKGSLDVVEFLEHALPTGSE